MLDPLKALTSSRAALAARLSAIDKAIAALGGDEPKGKPTKVAKKTLSPKTKARQRIAHAKRRGREPNPADLELAELAPAAE